MKAKKNFIVRRGITAGLLTAAVSMGGCSHGRSGQTVNELTFSLDSIKEITISYDERKY